MDRWNDHHETPSDGLPNDGAPEPEVAAGLREEVDETLKRLFGFLMDTLAKELDGDFGVAANKVETSTLPAR